MFPISASSINRRSFPFINVIIISACIIVFVYELFIDRRDLSIFTYRFGLIPSEIITGINYKSLVMSRGTFDITSPIPNWATLITSLFIHGGWMHIGANMLFLWVFGSNIEDRFGHFKYLVFYLAAGVAAGYLHAIIERTSQIPTIGASGAIAGVLGTYLILFPTSRIGTIVFTFIIGYFRIPAIIILSIWFLLQLVSGVGTLDSSIRYGGTAYWAHIGGFIFGIMVGTLYRLISWGRHRPSGHHRPTRFDTAIEPGEPKYWRGRRT